MTCGFSNISKRAAMLSRQAITAITKRSIPMAGTDIVLGSEYENDHSIQIQANFLYVQGSDLHLTSAERRRGGPTSPYRRALVHDWGDQLTINYAGDYPGGVHVVGTLKAEAVSVQQELDVATLKAKTSQ